MTIAVDLGGKATKQTTNKHTVRSQFVGLLGIRMKRFELFKTWPRIPRIEKSCLIPNKFLMHSWTLSLKRYRFRCVLRHSLLYTLNSFVGNREIKTSYKTKEEIVDGRSLRVTTPSRAYIRASPGS